MPNAYLQKLADKGKGSIDSLEKKWNKAKTLAKDQGHEDEYDYITGIFKKMIGESLTFKRFYSRLLEEVPTNTVGAGGVENPDGKRLFTRKPMKRKKIKKKERELTNKKKNLNLSTK